MNTQTTTVSGTNSGTTSRILPIIACALIGFAVMYTAGHVQAGVLHDAAHDVRHASGFPCH